MSESRSSEMIPTPEVQLCERDGRFFQALNEFIRQEKKFLRCPEEGPDELRYIIYRSAFNKVIGQATTYKKLLMTIKSEYDDTIRELKRREEEAEASQHVVASSASHPTSLLTCQRRAARLRDRICVLRRETAELQEELQRRRASTEQSAWIPGLTWAESEDPAALDRHLELLEEQREALLLRRSQSVPVEVKNKMDAELQAAQSRRERLSSENTHLRVQYGRLKAVCDCLLSWEEEQQVPLEELLENFRLCGESGDDERNMDTELFEDDEPSRISESKVLTDHMDSFIQLCDAAQYEDAALLAARAPRGVLRNCDTMEMFEGAARSSGPLPPPLLFFRALLVTAPPADRLSAPLSLHAARCALQHGALQLVTHAVTQNKLTFSEDLGDILTEHAQKSPGEADLCLTLATIIYEACGLVRKTALSMCRRGLIHSAAEFMRHREDITAEDCMWVLCRSPSLSLLQLLMEPRWGQAAILSAGVVCADLLVDPQQQRLALQLLDGFVSRGREVLEEVILEDSGSSVDTWTDVASLCGGLKRADLSRAILTVLLDQSGTRMLSPDMEGARLMEHVFL